MSEQQNREDRQDRQDLRADRQEKRADALADRLTLVAKMLESAVDELNDLMAGIKAKEQEEGKQW